MHLGNGPCPLNGCFALLRRRNHESAGSRRGEARGGYGSILGFVSATHLHLLDDEHALLGIFYSVNKINNIRSNDPREKNTHKDIVMNIPNFAFRKMYLFRICLQCLESISA